MPQRSIIATRDAPGDGIPSDAGDAIDPDGLRPETIEMYVQVFDRHAAGELTAAELALHTNEEANDHETEENAERRLKYVKAAQKKIEQRDAKTAEKAEKAAAAAKKAEEKARGQAERDAARSSKKAAPVKEPAAASASASASNDEPAAGSFTSAVEELRRAADAMVPEGYEPDPKGSEDPDARTERLARNHQRMVRHQIAAAVADPIGALERRLQQAYPDLTEADLKMISDKDLANWNKTGATDYDQLSEEPKGKPTAERVAEVVIDQLMDERAAAEMEQGLDPYELAFGDPIPIAEMGLSVSEAMINPSKAAREAALKRAREIDNLPGPTPEGPTRVQIVERNIAAMERTEKANREALKTVRRLLDLRKKAPKGSDLERKIFMLRVANSPAARAVRERHFERETNQRYEEAQRREKAEVEERRARERAERLQREQAERVAEQMAARQASETASQADVRREVASKVGPAPSEIDLSVAPTSHPPAAAAAGPVDLGAEAARLKLVRRQLAEAEAPNRDAGAAEPPGVEMDEDDEAGAADLGPLRKAYLWIGEKPPKDGEALPVVEKSPIHSAADPFGPHEILALDERAPILSEELSKVLGATHAELESKAQYAGMEIRDGAPLMLLVRVPTLQGDEIVIVKRQGTEKFVTAFNRFMTYTRRDGALPAAFFAIMNEKGDRNFLDTKHPIGSRVVVRDLPMNGGKVMRVALISPEQLKGLPTQNDRNESPPHSPQPSRPASPVPAAAAAAPAAAAPAAAPSKKASPIPPRRLPRQR